MNIFEKENPNCFEIANSQSKDGRFSEASETLYNFLRLYTVEGMGLEHFKLQLSSFVNYVFQDENPLQNREFFTETFDSE